MPHQQTIDRADAFGWDMEKRGPASWRALRGSQLVTGRSRIDVAQKALRKGGLPATSVGAGEWAVGPYTIASDCDTDPGTSWWVYRTGRGGHQPEDILFRGPDKRACVRWCNARLAGASDA